MRTGIHFSRSFRGALALAALAIGMACGSVGIATADQVKAGPGIEVEGDTVSLAPPNCDGSAYDYRFIRCGEPGAIGIDMLAFDLRAFVERVVYEVLSMVGDGAPVKTEGLPLAVDPHDHFGETWTGSAPHGLKISNGSATGKGIYGVASATGGNASGVYGQTASDGGRGVYGYAASSTGDARGVYGWSASDGGKAIFGWASAPTGVTYGGYFQAESTSATGLYGFVPAASGPTTGIEGRVNSTSGRALKGWATASSGNAHGVYGVTNSVDGYGGYFTGGKGVFATGFTMPTGAVDGYVLLADSAGAGTWSDPEALVWGWSGNSGTTAGTDFLGTADDQPLEIKVNSSRVMRYEPHAYGPNVLGGYSGNSIGDGAYGATVAGGGGYDADGAVWLPNTVTDLAGTVGGGAGNQAGDNNGDPQDAQCATVAGGAQNTASGDGATVSGGYENAASGEIAVVGGGEDNTASNDSATVGGGYDNTASGGAATVGGGESNTASDDYASVGGGEMNEARNWGATVGGGSYNEASGERAAVGGGFNNIASGNWTTLSGGYENTATNDCATVGGGYDNTASGENATVPGGISCSATGSSAAVGGGAANTASGDWATTSGGEDNWASNDYATVGGGYDNEAGGDSATVSGGYENTAGGSSATVAGGEANTASANGATVGGGYENTAGGGSATIAGGYSNAADGNWAAVPGGLFCSAAGNYSFAAGRRAIASNPGSFVWADSTDADFTVAADNRFGARASGGFYFYTNAGATSGAYLAAGSGTWADQSDRNQKAGFASIDERDVLAKVAAMPITTWHYKAEGTDIQHMGPMAQDMRAAFGLGDSDKSICTIDGNGVALAAIKGLHKVVQEKDAEIAALRSENKAILDRLARLEAAMAERLAH